MHYRPLGTTGLRVSVLCLGTMTFGQQNTEAEGHRQMELALDHGVNMVDTAEMYAVPPSRETQGETERILGSWFKHTGKRDRMILATKVTGPSAGFPWIRDGKTRLVTDAITDAVEGSLRRLGTDVIDLYQLHWPNRHTNIFGQLGYAPDPEEDFVPPEETLRALEGLVTSGKVRFLGLSNESPWGVMRFLAAAEAQGLPRMQAIQNPYSLLNRSYEIGLAEISDRERIGLLAYSPLAGGSLTGKYLDGARPQGSRWTIDPRGSRYDNPHCAAAIRRYGALARDHGLDPGQMALAYVNSRPFLTATIIGATTEAQLLSNLASANVTLPEAVLAGIEAIHTDHPNPGP